MNIENCVAATQEAVTSVDDSYHHLHDKWTLWAHLPHDTKWTLSSYKKITTFSRVEEVIAVYEFLPEKMIKNCMLFLMREGIEPRWEDKKNRAGGCFSYKVPNKNTTTTWKNASYALVGETMTKCFELSTTINGITISPKKNFCIIKIWMSTCDEQNPEKIKNIAGIVSHGCLFRKHDSNS
tara:strand:- start:2580 stop:3122 length:543 start_codon:yes stop_codon:yes gene_type:complete